MKTKVEAEDGRRRESLAEGSARVALVCRVPPHPAPLPWERGQPLGGGLKSGRRAAAWAKLVKVFPDGQKSIDPAISA